MASSLPFSTFKLNNSSPSSPSFTLIKSPIKSFLNFYPVINVGNNNKVCIQTSKLGNPNPKSLPIVKDEKSGGESRGGNNLPPPNGGGGGGAGDGDEDDYAEKKLGPLMTFEQVKQAAEEKGVQLPADILATAKESGLRKFILTRYLGLMGSGSTLGFFTRNFPTICDRMLADPSFLFKVGTEMVIDSCCATFAEVQKRGKDFWDEFELYVADLLVGIVVNFALVGMLAPYARIGKPSVASGGLEKSAVLPTSFLKFEKPGRTFSTQQLRATLLYKGSRWALGFLTTSSAKLLDKMFPDLQFLFGAGIEILIDSCCATFAEIQKRGKDLWDEIKSYAVGLLAGMLAPHARTGNRSVRSGLNNFVAALPSSDERHQRLTIYTRIYRVEQVSSFYNYTDPMATFSLGGTSQRDERVTMVRENEVQRVTLRTRVYEFQV